MARDNSPMNRRRVGPEDPRDRFNYAIRLSRESARIIEALRQPKVLIEGGCPKGDVIEVAIRVFAEGYPEIVKEVQQFRRDNPLPVS